jgi:cytochrome-b5 reductase
VEVMIKRYETYGLSSLLHSLKEGDTVQMYLADKDHHEEMNFREIHLRHKHIGIVTAGTALAPMISVRPLPPRCYLESQLIPRDQIIRSVLYNAEANDTRLTLIYANRHEEDILLRKELEELWQAHPSRLTIYFLLSQVGTPLPPPHLP